MWVPARPLSKCAWNILCIFWGATWRNSVTFDLFKDTGAEFSACEKYRYSLWRIWDVNKPYVLFLMLNPSTADDLSNDPTVERCERRVRKMSGFGGLKVANIFAYRATNPREMKRQPDPIGPDNNAAIIKLATEAGMVVCAWGNHASHLDRGKSVRSLLKENGIEPYALGITGAGEPNHPLYIGYDVKPRLMEL